jgi:pseudomonalisin
LCLSVALTRSIHAQVKPRIPQPVDNARFARLQRTTHPLVRTATDLGRVPADLPMDRMLLQLARSPQQEAALHQLMGDQQNSGSPRYQAWLTPEQFGEQFGPAQQDIDAITRWLESQGFRVNEVAKGRGSIEFSGTAHQVEQAFRTEIHHFRVNGERHVANSTDIAIPDALTQVVAGVVSMHDFRIQPMHHRIEPSVNLAGGSHAITPYDFAAIYNVATLWNEGFDGAGQTIAIAGRTNINASDIASFRSLHGLPANNPQIIVNGPDPGIVSPGEETEADLDVEWSGAVAKGAAVKFVTTMSTNAADGVDLSNEYIVNNNIAPVMSLSFGLCEAYLAGVNAFYNSLWQQAAAQGMSVFVSSGDTGSAGCDDPASTTGATQGLGVNGLGSTPYNVAVGGTEFSDANAAAYWNPFNDAHYASAKGYIPEVVWNESAYTTAGDVANNLFGGGGGVSNLYPTPPWQAGRGVPSADPGTTGGHHRYVPDVSLTAAGHDGYIVVQEGGLALVGGTSASSPSFAGIMAIINQYTGARNGNPNPKLYALAAQFPAVFHDTTGGSNAVPCAGGSPGCSAPAPSTNIGHMNGYAAAAGYDLATGWGSVDTFALAVDWGAATVTVGCSYSRSPASASVPFIGGTGTLSVTAATGCSWTAVSNATWLTVTSGATGSANGAVGYSVAANPNFTPRSGTLTAAGQAFTVTQAGVTVVGPQALRFVPVTPCRIADTRSPTGPFGGPALGAGGSRDFTAPLSVCGIPANAMAYSLNVSVVPLGPLSFLSLWPAGQPQPLVATLNSGDGRIKGNAAIVPAGANGAITAFATQATHLIIDINGYFVPAIGAQNLAFYPVTPCRVADTRNATGPLGGPTLAAAAARNFPVLSSPCGIPATAQAYSVNMTAVPPGVLGFLTTWPAGLPQPLVSTLNAPPGVVTANAAIVPAGVSGAISVFASQATNLVIDINGYFAPPGAGSLDFFTTTPCRILDTRWPTGPMGGPMMGAGESRSFPIPSSACGIPATAKAYSMNATAVPASILSFLTLWGSGGSKPLAATLNAGDGAVTGNAALVPAGALGAVTAFTTHASHLIFDINGYFQ